MRKPVRVSGRAFCNAVRYRNWALLLLGFYLNRVCGTALLFGLQLLDDRALVVVRRRGGPALLDGHAVGDSGLLLNPEALPHLLHLIWVFLFFLPIDGVPFDTDTPPN